MSDTLAWRRLAIAPFGMAPENPVDQQMARKTFKENLRPTPAQERALEEAPWR